MILRDMVAHLRQNRKQLCEEWARRITDSGLLTAMTEEEVLTESIPLYDQYVEALENGNFDAVQTYARDVSELIIPRGVEPHEAVGIALLLRDVLARSLFARYQEDFTKLNRVLDVYEPATNRISKTVSAGLVQERERVMREQKDAIRELSTPMLQIRERLLVLPIIGPIDLTRVRRLTEEVLVGIQATRAKVVVIDIAGVAALDSNVATHLVSAVEASGLLGATVIVSGLSPEIAQTLVEIGADRTKLKTAVDLQGGIEEAERQLGYRVVQTASDGSARAWKP